MNYPKDKYIIPISVPLIVVLVTALNNDPLYKLLLETWFWRDTIAGCLVAGVVWLAVRWVTVRLDKKAPWKQQFARRLFLQSVFGWFIPSLVMFGLCWLMFELVIGQSMFETMFPYYEYPFTVLLIAMINGYYLVYNLFETETVRTILVETKPNVSNATLFAFKGPDKFPLQHDMISTIIKSDAYLSVYTFDGERLNMSGTLDALEKNLPNDVFFRVNRQVIMHQRSIKSFRSIENGKIEIKPELEGIEPPIVSQKRAADFRKWMITINPN